MPHYVLDARTATAHFPGIGRYVRSLIPPMTDALRPDERLTVIIPTDMDANGLEDYAAVHPVADSPFSLRQQRTIPKLLNQVEADLYHSAYLLMPYRTGVPTVLTIHDIIPLLFPDQSTWRARTLFSLSLRLALKAAQGIVYNSHTTHRDTEQLFNVKHKYNAVTRLAAAPQFQPADETDIAMLHQRLCLPERYLLYVGSNKPHKNLALLIRAYASLREKQPQCPSLVIAGHWDPRYPEARQLAHELNQDDAVHWAGAQSEKDMPALYSGSMLFIFPSLYEGFGLPVLEAMACGTPVICADVPALAEITADAAPRFDPHTPDGLSSLLEYILNNAKMLDDFRQRGLERAQLYSWNRTAQQTLMLYRQVLADTGEETTQ